MVQAGVAPARLSAQGNAQYNPILPDTDEASRTKNRRVDIVVLYPPVEAAPTSPIALPRSRDHESFAGVSGNPQVNLDGEPP